MLKSKAPHWCQRTWKRSNRTAKSCPRSSPEETQQIRTRKPSARVGEPEFRAEKQIIADLSLQRFGFMGANSHHHCDWDTTRGTACTDSPLTPQAEFCRPIAALEVKNRADRLGHSDCLRRRLHMRCEVEIVWPGGGTMIDSQAVPGLFDSECNFKMCGLQFLQQASPSLCRISK
jgi:hypothetical protein